MTAWRTHLPVLTGSAALLLAAWLAVVATPRWRAEATQAMQTQRQAVRATAGAPPPADARLVQALPRSDASAARIQALVAAAQAHGIRLDNLRQSPPLRLGQGAGQLAAERVPLQLSGHASYSAWRQFVADALQQDDALLLDDLRLHRSGPTEPLLAGTLQWALLQQLPGAAAAPTAAPLPTRPADWPAAPATALAAWQPPAAKPVLTAAAPQAAAPSAPPAPPFPYRWIGQLDDGGPPQALLASAQRSVAVRLGDTLDGRWRLLRGADGRLLAQALPDGTPLPVPGAPAAALP
ncbi:GspMb/PilO family protein [Pseudaquabacterium pictum]|uniref:Uncharacterized protein n=1 Tax=Pseudaquabacterium pictum TaxID=2315236 RepID=A0A480AND4_9BURK|nr:GspMb/PilO family protein [Rubrivivax pictus]GCL62903.1 hypothetical protein AQPW35_19840 [Rubrivivax pictus]